MALEIHGLQIVTGGIFSGFKSAIETATLLRSALDDNADDIYLAVMYETLLIRLEEWGRFCGVDDFKNADQSDHLSNLSERIKGNILDTLQEIKKLTQAGDIKKDKHSLSLPPTTPGDEVHQNGSKKPQNLKDRLTWTSARISWVKFERQEFESIISKLDKFITNLEALVPQSRLPSNALIPLVLRKVGDEQLGKLSDSKDGYHLALALTARVKKIGLDNHGAVSQRAAREITFIPDSSTYATLRNETEFRPVWIEWHIVEAGPRSREYVKRIQSLGYLLEQVSEPAICLPPCLGIYEDTAHDGMSGSKRLGFVFGIPGSNLSTNTCTSGIEYDGNLFENPPRTLASLIRDKTRPIPALGERFRLALTLAITFSYFHAAGWLHKGLNAESILFFNEAKTKDINITRPFIIGFQFSRPDDQISQSRGPLENEAFTQYYHPDAHKGFNKPMDLYGLGVILCEIGHWVLMSDRVQNSRHKSKLINRTAWRDFMISSILQDLGWRMGTQYQSAVKTLLSADLPKASGDQVFALKYLQDIIRPLSNCMA